MEELVVLDKPTAQAVQTVLSRAGIISESQVVDDDNDELMILVKPDDRERAFSIMANRMDEVLKVRDLKIAGPTPKRLGSGIREYLAEDENKPKLLTTRLKDIAFIVTMFLIPGLLTVTSYGSLGPSVIGIIWGAAFLIAGVWFMSGRNK